MHAIFVRRRSKLHVAAGEGAATSTQLATLQKELTGLGYVMSEALSARLATLDASRLASVSRDLLRELHQLTGAHQAHRPFYPGFPDQVMAASDAELFLNAIHHYLTHSRLPDDEPRREAALEGQRPRVLDLGSPEEFERIFTQLAGAPTSLSQQDREDVTWFIRQYREGIFRLLPAKFPFKENLALVAAMLLREVPGERANAFLLTQCGTATDLLRVAVSLFEGDASLAAPTRFGRMGRAWRKLILQALEGMHRPVEDMMRWREPWKRLGERLHPGEFAERFPQAHEAFQQLRNDTAPPNWASGVERALATGDVATAAARLAERPGEYARKLDVLLRSPAATPELAVRFATLAPRVSTPVLLQVMTHFRHRAAPPAIRAFTPKGEMSKIFSIADRRPAVPQALAATIVDACEQALLARFAELAPLGPSYIDPALRNYMIPLAQRSASKSLRTLARGSRVPLPTGETLRFFLWWKNGRGRTDIDLSAAMFDSEYRLVEALGFYNLRGTGGYGVHSGDIVDAPQGAAEFIDLDLPKVHQRGARFVVMCINSYTAQAYCDLPECFAGWMSRRHPGSGEAFDARTVVDKIDISANTKICLPLILDLERHQMLWADLALTEHPHWHNAVPGNHGRISQMLRAMHETIRPDLYTLFDLHVRARGERVQQREQARTIFSVDEGIVPLALDEIRAAFL
ncbi:Stress response protein SCP2 [Mitsuaria sp. PDC51]|uniref:TerD family protein n=1 Tax=Mitsuaria sp. PDC51 TaxID=1881035 RepID=UPI0008E4BD4E|nr:TerD family protein [Mitsuaria sp. PDC51]SFR88368.1 Stress response protein SCP2 [Mitsuaria sp. PDC51]